jgi:hypothetical protein
VRVRCLSDSLTIEQRRQIGYASTDLSWPVTPGKEYLVLGMSFYIGSLTLGTGTYLDIIPDEIEYILPPPWSCSRWSMAAVRPHGLPAIMLAGTLPSGHRAFTKATCTTAFLTVIPRRSTSCMRLFDSWRARTLAVLSLTRDQGGRWSLAAYPCRHRHHAPSQARSEEQLYNIWLSIETVDEVSPRNQHPAGSVRLSE